LLFINEKTFERVIPTLFELVAPLIKIHYTSALVHAPYGKAALQTTLVQTLVFPFFFACAKKNPKKTVGNEDSVSPK
jgi:hypothetical protein